MRKSYVIAAALSTALIAGKAQAAESGYQLYSECTSGNNWDKVVCLSYIRGVWDAMVVTDIVRKTGFICTDGHDVRASEMLDVWTSWARLHPKDLKNEAGVDVGASYIDTYPCGSK